MTVLAACLLCQLGLVFVESKEEEELSLRRQGRMDAERQQMQINATLASKMDEALQANDLDQYTSLKALRRD